MNRTQPQLEHNDDTPVSSTDSAGRRTRELRGIRVALELIATATRKLVLVLGLGVLIYAAHWLVTGTGR
jgi:hypothetical protein